MGHFIAIHLAVHGFRLEINFYDSKNKLSLLGDFREMGDFDFMNFSH